MAKASFKRSAQRASLAQLLRRIGLSGTGAELLSNEDVKRAYLGS